MKRLSYLLLISILSLTACKKKYCWECITETIEGATIAPITASYCDITAKDIKDKEGRKTSEVLNGVKKVTITTNTTCIKKD